MESKIDSNNAVFWVEIADSLESADVTIYVYYGKADATYPYLATDTAQGEATFLFFDHFVGDALDTNKWTVTMEGNGRTVSSSILKLLGNSNQLIVAKTFSQGYGRMSVLWHCDVVSNDGDPADYTEFGWGNRYVAADAKYVEFYPNIGYGIRRTNLTSANTGAQTLYINSGDMTAFRLTQITWSSSIITVTNPDGSVTQTSANFIPKVALIPKLAVFDLVVNNAMYLDWIFFSKFVATEPAHSTWGAEEEEGIHLFLNEAFLAIGIITNSLRSYMLELFHLSEVTTKDMTKRFFQGLLLQEMESKMFIMSFLEQLTLTVTNWSIFPIIYYCTAYLLQGVNYAKTLYKRLKAYISERLEGN